MRVSVCVCACVCGVCVCVCVCACVCVCGGGGGGYVCGNLCVHVRAYDPATTLIHYNIGLAYT